MPTVTIRFKDFNEIMPPTNLLNSLSGMDGFQFGTHVGGDTALNTKDDEASYVSVMYVLSGTLDTQDIATATGYSDTPIPATYTPTSNPTLQWQGRYTSAPTSTPTPPPLPLLYAWCPSLDDTILISLGTLYRMNFSAGDTTYKTEADFIGNFGFQAFYGGSLHPIEAGGYDGAAKVILETVRTSGYFVFMSGNASTLRNRQKLISQYVLTVSYEAPATSLLKMRFS